MQLQSEKYVAMTKKVLSDLLTISNQTCHDKVIDHFLEHTLTIEKPLIQVPKGNII
jgi:hypothetical protein